MRRHRGFREKIRGWTAQIVSIFDDSRDAGDLKPFDHLKGQLRLLPNIRGRETVVFDDEFIELNVTFRSYDKANVAILQAEGEGGFIIWSGTVYQRNDWDRKQFLKGLTSHCYLSSLMADPHKGQRHPESATLCSSSPLLFGDIKELRFEENCTCGTKKVFVEGETKRFCPTCRC